MEKDNDIKEDKNQRHLYLAEALLDIRYAKTLSFR